jgi:hypothetical protein
MDTDREECNGSEERRREQSHNYKVECVDVLHLLITKSKVLIFFKCCS